VAERLPGGAPERVATGLLRRGGRVLLCHRSPDRRWYPGCWDVPGGHLEPGEAPAQALVRELREELGVTVALPGPPAVHVGYPDWSLDAWVLDSWQGEPANLAPHEHDALAWVDAGEAAALPLADPYVLALVRAALRG
jgi:8-oxo-dGTP diphosphatase